MTTAVAARTRNGVDIDKLFVTLDVVKGTPALGSFVWRADNRWIDGSHNQTTIRTFFGAGQEDHSRDKAFTVDAGEPGILIGEDDGPNPAEYLLHALAACLTTSLVYVAAARGVELESVESHLDGDMDVRGTLGLSKEVRNGFERIRATFKVKGKASPETLQEIVDQAQARSAVFDSILRGVPISVNLVNDEA